MDSIQSSSAGVHTWRVRIDALDNNYWIMFAVAQQKLLSDSSYGDASVFGVASQGQIYRAGQPVYSPNVVPNQPFHAGHFIVCCLDCDRGVFEIKNESDAQTYRVEGLPTGTAFVPHINAYRAARVTFL